jgi:hemerythrin-like metal-binding protein
MAIFEWDESISLNIPMIDDQHRQLIGWVAALNDAVQKSAGAQAIEQVLLNLTDYVFNHFSGEERLMLSINFPGLDGHRQEHNFFVTRLEEIMERFQNGEEIGNDTLEFMSDWIVGHIKGTDRIYGSFMLAGSDRAGV